MHASRAWPARLAAGLAALALVATGCSGGAAAKLRQDEFGIILKPGASAADADRVAATCGRLPGVRVLVGAGGGARPRLRSAQAVPVRVDLGPATVVQRSLFFRCLADDGSVVGYRQVEVDG